MLKKLIIAIITSLITLPTLIQQQEVLGRGSMNEICEFLTSEIDIPKRAINSTELNRLAKAVYIMQANTIEGKKLTEEEVIYLFSGRGVVLLSRHNQHNSGIKAANTCILRPPLISKLNVLKKGKIGILPHGALTMAFFYHLGGCSTGDYIIAKGNSLSFNELASQGHINLEVDGERKIVDTKNILFKNLVTCYQTTGLPEVLIVAPLTDQLEIFVEDLIGLLEEFDKEGYFHSKSMLEQVMPIFVVASNGIFDKRLRELIMSRIDTTDKLKDMPEDIKRAVIGRIIRGIAIQGGERTQQVYRPGVKGSIHIAGGMMDARKRVKQIFEIERGFPTLVHNNPEEEELKKAILSVAGNAVTLAYILNKDGDFQDIRMGNLLQEPLKEYTEEICRAVYNVSVKMGHFKSVSFKVIWKDCLASIAAQYFNHRNSSVQQFIERLKKRTLKQELLPTEASLFDFLITRAEKEGLAIEKEALIDLKNKILANFKAAIINRQSIIEEIEKTEEPNIRNEIHQLIENCMDNNVIVTELVKSEGERLDILVETMIRLSVDTDIEPCGINHSFPNAIATACVEKPELMDIFAKKIKFLLETRNELLLQVAITEIVTKIIEVSFKKKDVKNIAQEFTTPELVKLLKTSFQRYRKHYDRIGYYPDETSFTGEDIVISANTILKAIDKNWYFIERDDRCIGIVEMYHNRCEANLNLFIRVFEQEHTHLGIGTEVMQWAAKYIGAGNTVTFLYPLDKTYLQFLWKCKEKRIFDDVAIEVMISQKDDFMKIRSSDYAWQKISSLEEAFAMLETGDNLFVRGTVRFQKPVLTYINSTI